MGIPVVIATNGFGLPVVDATAGGIGMPMTVATNGFGTPVVVATNGLGIPAVFSPPLDAEPDLATTSLRFNFMTDTARIAAANTTSTFPLTVTRATPPLAYAENVDGTWTGFAPNVARRTNKGLLIEEARTNVVLHNRDLTNAAWVKTSITAVKDQTGIDGVANAASKITATAANATCLQTTAIASSARWQTAFVKRLTGSGTVQMTQNGGTTWTTVTVTAGWTRVSVPTLTLANPVVGFRLVTSGDAIAVDMVQNENRHVRHLADPDHDRCSGAGGRQYRRRRHRADFVVDQRDGRHPVRRGRPANGGGHVDRPPDRRRRQHQSAYRRHRYPRRGRRLHRPNADGGNGAEQPQRQRHRRREQGGLRLCAQRLCRHDQRRGATDRHAWHAADRADVGDIRLGARHLVLERLRAPDGVFPARLSNATLQTLTVL